MHSERDHSKRGTESQTLQALPIETRTYHLSAEKGKKKMKNKINNCRWNIIKNE